jgi:phage-related protein (TIGR01555 family)
MARPKRRAIRRDSAPPAARSDGWENVLTGLGNLARDKRMGTRIAVRTLTTQEAELLWRGDDMAAKVIEKPAREMVRRWIDVLVEQDAAAAQGVAARLDELKARSAVREALKRARAFGGAGILLGTDDGTIDLSKPLAEKGLKTIRWLTVFDADELAPVEYYRGLEDEKYGEPSVYEIHPRGGAAQFGARVHESRFLLFKGVQVSRRHAAERNSWGDSVLVRVMEVLSDVGMAWGGAAHLLSDFSQAVFRIRGLAEAIATGREDLIRKRIEAIELGRSIVRAALLDAGDPETGDAGESFERKATPLAGYPDMLEQFKSRLSAAADMPLSLLWGDSPKGLSTGDTSGQDWWAEHIEGLQDEQLREPINRLVRLILLAKDGPTKGKEPDRWSVRFRPLRQVTPLQEADRRLKNAQADAAYVQAGVVMPEEIAASRFGGDAYGEDVVLDDEIRGKVDGPVDPEAAPPISGVELQPKPAEAVDPTTALNGAQVSSLLEIIQAVASKSLPRETGVATIAASFPLSTEEADRLLGEVGRTFFLEAAPPVAPPAAAPPPGAPPAKP